MKMWVKQQWDGKIVEGQVDYNWTFVELRRIKAMGKSMLNGLLVGPDKVTDYVSASLNFFKCIKIHQDSNKIL